jgi:hypothetical protein
MMCNKRKNIKIWYEASVNEHVGDAISVQAPQR